ncbi:hypothetical protein HDU96_002537 [Phlyctochytrium bullatum]|nr:hypothetical protein HDU96_002537 [Phlyctochytrium bullatum]
MLVGVHAKSTSGSRLLVVLNAPKDQDRFSIFLDSLRTRGFDLDVQPASAKVSLVKFEELVYDHALILADSANAIGGINPLTLVDFQKRGGNVILAGSSSVSEAIRDIAIEYSVEIDEKGFAVHDDFFHLGDDPLQVTTNRFVGPPGILSESVRKGPAVVYTGVGARLTGRNKLIHPVLAGTATSYSWVKDPKKPLDKFAIVGSNLALVSALQTLNNARIVFSGSLDLFSNEFVEKKLDDGSPSGNLGFITDVSKWAFQERGVLKVKSVFHHRPGEDKTHGAYRIKDDMVYRIEISEYRDDRWVPYHANDVQFEAVMLDPYIRSNLTQLADNSDAGVFETTFTLPDVYGVFTFKVDYRRHGWTWLETKETVAIRPFRHNQYPRFLVPAYPYYVNSFSMIVGFFALSALVLYHGKPLPKDAGPKKLSDAKGKKE